MANVFAKFIANAVSSTAGVVTRAFAQAYRNVAAGARAKHAAEGGDKAVKSAWTKNQVRLPDAQEILDIEPETTRDEARERFEALFQKNDVKQGGSFYLQSKIYRAYQAVERDFEEREGPAAGEAEGAAAATTAAEGGEPQQTETASGESAPKEGGSGDKTA